MKIKHNGLVITSVAAICVLAAAGLSKPGRVTLTKVLTVFQQAPDVEQRARAQHGWTSNIQNSAIKGAITYYDRNGMATSQANLTLYRGYPNRLRIELERNGATEVSGFDGVLSWKAGLVTLSEEAARDIRSFLRVWPERLFTTRAAAAAYREIGRRVEEDMSPARPVEATPAGPPPKRAKILDQVEMADTLGPLLGLAQTSDRRQIDYYINRESSLVETARWLEPVDPRKSIDDRSGPLLDERADFSDWRTVNGVSWPFQITHRLGGPIDYVVQLSEVKLNQTLADVLFQRP